MKEKKNRKKENRKKKSTKRRKIKRKNRIKRKETYLFFSFWFLEYILVYENTLVMKIIYIIYIAFS